MARYHINGKTGRPNICRAQPGNCPLGADKPHYDSKEEAKAGLEKGLSQDKSFLTSQTAKKSHVNVDNAQENTLSITSELENNISGGQDRGFNIYSYLNKKMNNLAEDKKYKWRDYDVKGAQNLDTIVQETKDSNFSLDKLEELKNLNDEMKPYATKQTYSAFGYSPYSERCEHMHKIGSYALKEWSYKNNMTNYSEVPQRELNDSLIGVNDAVYQTLSEEEDFSARMTKGKYDYGKKTSPEDVNDVLNYIAHNGNNSVEVPGYDREEVYESQEDSYIFEGKDALRDRISHDNALYMRTAFPEQELKSKMEEIGINNVSVSPLNNGREVGLAYTVITPNGDIRTFSVYEHRNTDSIIINGKTNWQPGELPYTADHKEAFFAELPPENRKEAADTLCYYMSQAQKGELEDDVTLANKVERRDWGNILSESVPGFKEYAEKNDIPIRKKPKTDKEVLDDLDFNLDFDFDD